MPGSFEIIKKQLAVRLKHAAAEESIMLISVLKWTVLATITGVIVGFSSGGFLLLLKWATNYSGQYYYYFLLLPVGFFISSVLVKYLAPEAKGHGTEKVIEAVHKRSGKIALPVVPVKLVATLATLVVGGSVGKEGPSAQIGAGLASAFADLFRFGNSDRKKLVICGISAGFASVFGTPIAGSIFGIEVLFIGGMMYEVLLPSFIAGIISFEVSSHLGVSYFYHAIKFAPTFSSLFFSKVILAGIFFGVCSLLLIEGLKMGERIAHRMRFWLPLRGIVGGAFLIVLTLIFSRQFLGLGLDSIQGALTGAQIVWYAFLLKIVFTSITLGMEGSGGIITPIFFVGATAGSAFSSLLGLDPATFAAIGMVGLVAGAANTPIAASILTVELFGPAIAPYAAIAAVISFLISGHRSVYPSQVLAMAKSPSLEVEKGCEIVEAHPTFALREKSLISFLYYRVWRFLCNLGGRRDEGKR